MINSKLELDKLNNEQYQAVTAPLGPILVVAGAGTGKTSVLTKRIAYLIENFNINHNKILAITFTNKAALEMNERIEKLIKFRPEWIGTFHGICIRILRKHINLLNRNSNFKIIDDEEATVLLKEIYKEYDFEVKSLSYRNAISAIDKFKTKNISQVDFLNNSSFHDYDLKTKKDAITFWKIYETFLKRCELLNLLDFNDILNLAYQLLVNNQQAREYWTNFFDYVLVDEFQDTNEIQYNLVKILASKNKNLFVVGDPDQTIYTWRGAKQSIINNFSNELENAKTIILNKNYRSTQPILEVANKLIKNNTNRIHKDLMADNNNYFDKPNYFVGATAEMESNWVSAQIHELLNNGVLPNDIVILYRSNYLSRQIEQSLVQLGIRYTIYGGMKFYQRSEIKDMLAYLSAISNHDEISLRRIINLPARRISDKCVKELLDYAHTKDVSFWDACLEHNQNPNLTLAQNNAVANFVELMNDLEMHKNQRLDKFVVEIMKKINYEEYLENLDKNKVENKLEYISELLNAMTKYMDRNTNWTLEKYLQDIMLFISSDDKNNKVDTINLMTIHTSKGLEFKYVFIYGFNDGIFPSYKNLSHAATQEERRIAYVAITRAKQNLSISCNNDYSVRLQQNNIPSRFIDEIGLENLNQIKPKIKVRSNFDLDFFDSNSKPININNFYSDVKNDYKIGDQIVHVAFGLGVIVEINGDFLKIRFNPEFGIKEILYNHKNIKRSLG